MKRNNSNYDEGMWKGAPSSSFGKVKSLRNKETQSEKLLWDRLRNNQFEGLKFRRQHPIDLYIADFYCHQFKLIIELDGGYHYDEEQKVKDKDRTQVLNFNNLYVLRFKNEEVEENIEEVLFQIKRKIESLKDK